MDEALTELIFEQGGGLKRIKNFKKPNGKKKNKKNAVVSLSDLSRVIGPGRILRTVSLRR